MKILFTRFPLESALNGGAEKQTIALMQGLMNRGHAVAFAGSCAALLTMCREKGIPAAEWQIGAPPVTKWGAMSFAWRKAAMKKKLTALLDEIQPDAIVMLSLSEKLLLTDVAAQRGIKVIWIEHDKVGNWLKNNPWLPTLLEQSKYATTIVVSELSKKIYEGIGWDANNLVAIANGVDEKIPLKLAAKRSPLNALQLGCIARLSPEKGIDVLLSSIADLPNIHLEIIGTGREEKNLHALAQSLKIADRVTFTPNEADIAAAYARFDVLVLPSKDHDPFGMVAAEAMMAGIPVIVTDACGIAGYLVNGKDAMVVKANSPSALKEAIEKMQKAEVRELIGTEGQKTAEKKFMIEKMIDAYETVFKKGE